MASLRNYTAALLVLIVGASIVPKAFLDQSASKQVAQAADINPLSAQKSALTATSVPVRKSAQKIGRKTLPAYAVLASTDQPPSPENTNRLNRAAASEVRWIGMEEALAANEKKRDKKPIFIDLYTDWCGWCKRMDATTFQDPVLVQYLNERYHCVKFNAETHGPFTYFGQVLALPSTSRPTHPFALMVGAQGGSIGYPTVAILDSDNKKLTTLPGYQTAQALEPLLVYYAEGYYKEFDYATFKGMYAPKSGQ
ncbi:MAG: DUF255 domain-containing protein [Bacteroidetes bacterium]|nr:DUF255 domain-containing protein [Bacteroidota bacterium]